MSVTRAGERPWAGRRLHLVGIGGAGMSAYARAAHALGAELSGSDTADSVYARALASEGVLSARIGHDARNVPPGDDVELVYSSAVPPENAERVAARERGLAERSRAQLLAELTALRRTIAVAGTHGKTTTAAMTVHALRAADLDPGWLIGGTIGGGLANSHWSESEWLVVEADESDRSMLSLDVEIAIITNVELDHHATYSSLAELNQAFAEFASRAKRAIVLWDRRELLALLPAHPRAEVVRFDLAAAELGNGAVRFQWRGHGVQLAVPGRHNALDAAAALEAARLTGADVESAIGALASFRGAGRRFQLLGRSARGALVYDDYAHHPTELAATLEGARSLAHDRLIAVFQPHLYSRTRLLASGFGKALALADVAVVLDVYPARERAVDHPGVSGLIVAEAAADAAGGRPVYWLAKLDAAERVLGELLQEGDLCVVMGAGSVDRLAQALVVDS